MRILRIHRLNVMWAFVHASNKDIPDSIDKIRAIVTYEIVSLQVNRLKHLKECRRIIYCEHFVGVANTVRCFFVAQNALHVREADHVIAKSECLCY